MDVMDWVRFAILFTVAFFVIPAISCTLYSVAVHVPGMIHVFRKLLPQFVIGFGILVFAVALAASIVLIPRD